EMDKPQTAAVPA
nr:Chain C, CARBOXY-TERMINAL PROCESSING PROTEASE CTPB [Bacillus subtilis subsp. subtilis str. 168]